MTLPKVGDKLIFEIGPGHRQGYGEQAVKIRPLKNQEQTAGADTLKAAV
jgi:hypothetical protein